jgi:hypothetical protein
VALCCAGFVIVVQPALADPPSVTISSPASFTFAASPGPTTVSATIDGGTPPYTAIQLYANGVATGPAQTGSGGSRTFSWNTTGLADGSYLLTVGATDSLAAVGTSAAVNVTLDQTPPLTAIASPSGSQYFQDSLPVDATASDAYGIGSVQFRIDGAAAGPPVTAPTSPGGQDYATSLDLTAFALGSHTLTEQATDNAGNTTVSSPVSFVVGSGPAVTVTSPGASSFVTKGIPVTATVTGGASPYTAVKLLVDGVATAVVPVASASSYTFTWDSATVADGAHTVAVSATDANGAIATSGAVSVTVQNTAAEATMYAPLPMPSYGYEAVSGATTFQVHASSAIGIRSVQFTVDGLPVGPLRTAPDAGQPYLYTIVYDTTGLSPGLHSVSATVVDNAGTPSTATPLEIKTGSTTYLPVLNYHGLRGPLDSEPTIYDQTSAEVSAQLSYLQANGYQSVTIEQYETWLATGAVPGVAKPVLITIDDGLSSEEAWDPLLAQYGFTAVLFAVTGFADSTTPGETDTVDNMPWSEVRSLVADGRWEVSFHAGLYGHGDYSDPANTVAGATYPASCWTFYTCFSETTGAALETTAAFEAAVTGDVAQGIAELKQEVPTANVTAWACPWNACAQWTNQFNDPTGAAQAWAPAYYASLFEVVFSQTDPVAYAQATGTIDALDAYNRHYRFEVLIDTTIDEFTAALTDPAFAFYPPLAPAAPQLVSASPGTAQATVSFSAAAPLPGLLTSYTVVASPGGFHASGTASPIVVTGLPPGSYTFTVTATNTAGEGPASGSSNAVTLAAPAPTPVAVVPSSGAGSSSAGGSSGNGGGSGGGSGAAPAAVVATPASVQAAAVAQEPAAAVTQKTVRIATVEVRRVKLFLRSTEKPRIVLTLKLARAGAFEIRLLDARTHLLVRWTERAKAGTATFVLALPPRARHAGRDNLWISQIGARTKLAALIAATLRF